MTTDTPLRPPHAPPPRRSGGALDRMAAVERSRGALAALGITLSVLLIGAVLVIVVTFRGAFTAYVPVDAVVAGNGNAVAAGSQVIFRDVPVGTVSSTGRVRQGGDVVVHLHIIPNRAPGIPANVTATVQPVDIFGTEYVVLTPPAHPTANHLAAGQVVPAAPANAGANVQGATTSLDAILKALHPAQLDMALTAVATALQGQGRGLGQTLVSIDSYLKSNLPYFPELEADLGLLAPVANQVAASAPALVGALSNLTPVSRTLTADAGALRTAFSDGAVASNQLYSLLAPTQGAIETILRAAGPFFADLSQTPNQLSTTLSGLQQWATSWAAAESSGPYLAFSSSVPLANATDIVFAALGAPGTAGPGGLGAQALGPGRVDPATYAGRAVPLAAVHSAPVSVDPAILTSEESAAAAQVTTGLANGRRPGSPTVAALYLGSLLNQLVLQ